MIVEEENKLGKNRKTVVWSDKKCIFKTENTTLPPHSQIQVQFGCEVDSRLNLGLFSSDPDRLDEELLTWH